MSKRYGRNQRRRHCEQIEDMQGVIDRCKAQRDTWMAQITVMQRSISEREEKQLQPDHSKRAAGTQVAAPVG